MYKMHSCILFENSQHLLELHPTTPIKKTPHHHHTITTTNTITTRKHAILYVFRSVPRRLYKHGT